MQAFRCGANAFGFQFHPEVTLEMKEIWTLKAAERLKQPGAQQRGVHLSMHALYDPPLDRWINGFLDRWLATDPRIASAALRSLSSTALPNSPPTATLAASWPGASPWARLPA